MTEHRIFCGDCLELMQRKIKDSSIDMILCDLPYGTTQNKWDSVISFDLLWVQYKRILKTGGLVVLTATQPFASTCVNSNLSWFKYEWIWEKDNGTGFLNAKKQPLRSHEQILVFYGSQCIYVPQMSVGKPYVCKAGTKSDNYGSQIDVTTVNTGERCPKTVLQFTRDKSKIHPTQKPVELWKYLLRTYTNEGAIVLDNCCGSGTTGVAAKQLGRHSIQMDISQEYCEIAKRRLEETEEGKG